MRVEARIATASPAVVVSAPLSAKYISSWLWGSVCDMKASSSVYLMKALWVRPAIPVTVFVTETLTELMPFETLCKMAPESIFTESTTFKMEFLTVFFYFSSNDWRNSEPPNTGISSKVLTWARVSNGWIRASFALLSRWWLRRLKSYEDSLAKVEVVASVSVRAMVFICSLSLIEEACDRLILNYLEPNANLFWRYQDKI